MKRIITIMIVSLLALGVSACGGANTSEQITENGEMILKIDETPVQVSWENNESVQALKEMIADAPLSIQMSMYGGFEQVGSIGKSLPRNDAQTTTDAGDIVLYSGDQMVFFYGSNSWAYTRLGHIEEMDPDELKDILGNGDVTITIEMQ